MPDPSQTSGSLSPPWVAAPKDPIEGDIDLPALLIIASIATLAFCVALVFVCFFVWKKTNPIYENKPEEPASPSDKSLVWWHKTTFCLFFINKLYLQIIFANKILDDIWDTRYYIVDRAHFYGILNHSFEKR